MPCLHALRGFYRHYPRLVSHKIACPIGTLSFYLSHSLGFAASYFLEIEFLSTQVLYQGTDAHALDNRGALANQLHALPKALRYLMKSLLEVYIDAEVTGTHTQYWDKFNSR